MLAIGLRPGNAGSNTAADHIALTRAALAQIPGGNPRPGKGVLVRADGAGGTKDFISLFTIPATLARHGRRVILHLSNRSRWAGIALPAPSG